MSTYAIGDIQGCYDPLRALLDKVNFDPSKDKLWGLGDLVNRGPKSLQTLRFLKSLGSAFESVLGNHDLHLLALATNPQTEGKKQYLLPILNADDCHDLCQWLRAMPLLRQLEISTDLSSNLSSTQIPSKGHESYLLLHAGLAPSWSLKQAFSYAKEVEDVLQSTYYPQFLKAMYGDHPDCWHEELKGFDRLRVITNYFTRMRYCNEQGKLQLSIKTGLDTAPEGYQPWYHYQQLNQHHCLLFGHWAALEGITNTPNIYALDTGCVWGRSLTMLRLEDKQPFFVDC